MDRIRLLLREPALLADAAETLIVFLIVLGLHISGAQETYLVAAVIAVAGAVKGFTTVPFPATVIPDAVRAVVVALTSFGVLHVPADEVAVLATVVGTLVTAAMRGQITPRTSPVVSDLGAGAGPVRATAKTPVHRAHKTAATPVAKKAAATKRTVTPKKTEGGFAGVGEILLVLALGVVLMATAANAWLAGLVGMVVAAGIALRLRVEHRSGLHR